MERVAPPDGDVRALELDDVVTGSRVPSQPQRRDRAGVDDEEILELPGVRHVLVAREHEMHLRALQALDRVAGVVDDVALAPRARYRQQVVVQHEDAKIGRLGRELLLSGAINRPATASAWLLSTIPVARQCPALDAIDFTCCF